MSIVEDSSELIDKRNSSYDIIFKTPQQLGTINSTFDNSTANTITILPKKQKKANTKKMLNKW